MDDPTEVPAAAVAQGVATEPVPMLLGQSESFAAAWEEIEAEEEAERWSGLE